MINQTKVGNGYSLKFLSTILFTVAVLVGGFFVTKTIFAVAGEGTAIIDGGASATVVKSTSHLFTIVLTVGASGITVDAANPTFTIPTGFTAPNAIPVANAGLVLADGDWSAIGGATCPVTMASSSASGQTMIVDVTTVCTVEPTEGKITLTYKGTSNTAMGATALAIGTADSIGNSPVIPISNPPTITVTETTPNCSSVCYVDAVNGNDTNDGMTTGTAKKTIQSAITQVSAGGTINVDAGNYPEQLIINKSLTITGAGSGTTIIQAPAVLANDADGAKDIVLVTGSVTTEISGFTIQGPVSGLNFGIYVRDGATANIHDNTIKDIRGEPFGSGDSQYGYAIEVGKYNNSFPYVSQVGHATITNNQVFGYQKTGIECEGAGSNATITGNTVTGRGPTTITAQNGIQIRRGATGTIDGNTVTGNAWDGPSWTAMGIFSSYAGSGVIIQNNISNHNSGNIYVYGDDGVQILNNQVSDSASVDQNKAAGITVQADNAATDSVGLTGVLISGNTVQNNLSGTSTQSDGIDIYGVKSGTVSNNTITGSSYDGILVGGSGNIVFTGNTFSNNGLLVSDSNAAAIDFRGIPSRDWSLPLGNGGPNTLGGFTVHNNSFSGNRNAIWNYDTGSVNATNNWWGSVSPVFASIISGPVTYDPYYIDVGMTATNVDLTDAKTTSHGVLTSALATYVQTKYTVENWVTLNGFKTAGDTAIVAATTLAGISSAQTTATNGMVGVQKLNTNQTIPDATTGEASSNPTTPEVVITNPIQAVTITVATGTHATVDVSAFITNGVGTLPKIMINSTVANVAIPASTTVTSADTIWNGVIAAQTVTNVTLPVITGETKTLSMAFEVGSSDVKLTFSNAVRILLPGQAGKRAGYVRDGINFTEITNTCALDDQATGDALAPKGDCKIDVGSDLVIWTKHFTIFATYTQTTNTVSSGGGGSHSFPANPVVLVTPTPVTPVVSVAPIETITTENPLIFIAKNIVPIVVNVLTGHPPLSGIIFAPVVVVTTPENPPLFDITSQPLPPTPQNRTPYIIIAIVAWILIVLLVLFIVRRITSYIIMSKVKKDMLNVEIKKNENIH